jgi:hypothetical protein
MRYRLLLSLVLFLAAATLSAAAPTITFDPPNPTSATPIVAHVPGFGCPPTGATFHRTTNIIGISLDMPQCLIAQPWEFSVNLGAVPAGVYDVVASPGQLLIAIAEGTLVVRDAAPPFEVVPNVLPAGTGGDIHLRALGQNLYACPVPVPLTCESFTVKIGGQPVNVVSSTQGEIVVTAPPHAAGVVDVTIDRNVSGPLTATAALDYFDADKAPAAAFFEPVVFPALVTGAGAFGSQWTTDVALRNDNDVPLPLPSPFFQVPCVPVCDTRPPAHSSIIRSGVNAPAGVVTYVPRQFAPRVFFDVLARDLSRQSEALGTEIPVVREKDLYDRPFAILLVPTDAKYRSALRVFRTDGGASVHLRIFSMNGDNAPATTPLVDSDLPLLAPSPSMAYSSAAIADLVARFPQLAGQGPLRIEIDGRTATRVTGALVSVTNNETQHITVISPH